MTVQLDHIRGHYVIKWNNGVWKIFDMWHYEDCQLFPSYILALKALYA
jgi:hypothetical protein